MLNVGDEVMMIEDELHAKYPENYPAKGSIGVVVQYSPRDKMALVDWGQDSGVNCNLHDKYTWWCGEKRLAKVNANTQVNTQKEVCNMSKFKVGDKVVFTNAKKHEMVSQFYPVVGTVGTVKMIGTGVLGENTLMVDWGNAEGVDVWEDGTKSWWCNEDDVKPYTCEEYEYTDDEVWEMLKPKMKRIVTILADVDNFHDEVKKMVVAAYRSGYGRATKGRSFIIKSKVDEKPSEKSIDDVLSGKTIVIFYKDDNSYNVANFAYSRENGRKTEIYADIAYSSAGDSWSFGFDVLNDPDCEMYVAIPFSEAVEQFDSKSIKALYCGNKPVGLCHIKQWAISEYNKMMHFGNQACVSLTFKPEWGMPECYPAIHSPYFKALVPICDYLKHEGVNV
jgi:hypothetical protein|nr:MAG TPA: hypothetical protein [Caudoviricetes sp.]